jgi:GT2 family glycosyltransferase
MKKPKVSLVLVTYKDKTGVERILRSVKRLTYPAKSLDLVVSDNNSQDGTVEVAKKYVGKVYICKADGYAHRAIAMRRAKSEFVFMILEQDFEIKSRDFVEQMVKPLVENPDLTASFTRYFPKKSMPAVTRFISYDFIQRDPFYEFLTPSIKSTIIKKFKGYSICRFKAESFPPVGHMMYRVSYLKKSGVWMQKQDFDLDTVKKLIMAGYDKFAYVPNAGIYHYHADSVRKLVNKRTRNLGNHYFKYQSETTFMWIDYKSKKVFVKILFWIIYVNLIIPTLVRGIYKAIKYKDYACVYLEPIVSIWVTDRILWGFLINKSGRKQILALLRNFYSKTG